VDYLPEQRDDYRHDLSDTPFARESTVYDIHLPDHGSMSLYTWVHGDGTAGSASILFGPLAGQKAVFELGERSDVPASDDFDDWTVGPLTVQVDGRLDTARIQVAGERLEVDARFESMHPAFLYTKAYDDPADGCPPGLAAHRFEQSGRVHGHLRLDGQTIEFDSFGHRDHSWGERDWESMQNFWWVEAQTDESAVNVFWVNAYGREYHLGYVYKDGVVSAIRDTTFDVDYDDRWVQDAVRVRIVDADGRTTDFSSQRYGRHEYPVGEATKLVDTAITVMIDGVEGLGYTSWSWPIEYLRRLRRTSTV
jgi:hypothetical protein